MSSNPSGVTLPHAVMSIDKNSTMVSNPQNRDGSQSSSADLLVQVKLNGSATTVSSIKNFETYAVIHGIKMNTWRHETGDISNKSMNSSSYLGMDEVEFTMPCGDFDITSLQTLAKGEVVDISFLKTANIADHNQKVQEFIFEKAQIVSAFHWVQAGMTASITVRFKPKRFEMKRYDYSSEDDKACGQKVYSIDFETNQSG